MAGRPNAQQRALDESDVRDWVGEAALARGRLYVAEGRVAFPRREGRLLSASLRGSLPTPYDVEVQVSPSRIEAAYCTCPVGGDGRCKHVAAVLLTWLQDPAAFVSPEDLVRALAERPSGELATIILKMVRRHPDLRSLLELPPVSGRHTTPPDPEALRRAVSEAFARGRYDAWREGETVASDLTDFLDLAASYRARDDWRAAALVYQAIASAIMERYEAVEDEGSHLASVLVVSIDGLGNGLAAAADAAERQALMGFLLQAYLWDTREFGLGVDERVREALLSHATAEERHLLSGWAWEAMPAGATAFDVYVRRAVGRLMLDLDGETLPDPLYLSLCREAALWGDMVARLLDRGRLEEALRVVAGASDADLLPLADLLVRAGHPREAHDLVVDRAASGRDDRPIEWLKDQARASDDPVAERDLAAQLFWRQPSLERYQELRELSQRLGRWEQERTEVVERLATEGRYRLLLSIALSEQDLEAALGYADAGPLPGDPAEFDLHVDIARLAEAGRPHDAIRLYLSYVAALVHSRGRPAYAEAARVLKRVRRLYGRLGEVPAWEAWFAQFRGEHRRLRALQEELTGAGLP